MLAVIFALLATCGPHLDGRFCDFRPSDTVSLRPVYRVERAEPTKTGTFMAFAP